MTKKAMIDPAEGAPKAAPEVPAGDQPAGDPGDGGPGGPEAGAPEPAEKQEPEAPAGDQPPGDPGEGGAPAGAPGDEAEAANKDEPDTPPGALDLTKAHMMTNAPASRDLPGTESVGEADQDGTSWRRVAMDQRGATQQRQHYGKGGHQCMAPGKFKSMYPKAKYLTKSAK